MALPIASIPVLTGEVAQRFEAEAQATYQRYLNRTEEEKKTQAEIMKKKFAELHEMLAKAHWGNKSFILDSHPPIGMTKRQNLYFC